MNRLPQKLNVPEGRDPEIEQVLLDMVLAGEAYTLYDPVRRDLLLLIPGQTVMLYPNEQN